VCGRWISGGTGVARVLGRSFYVSPQKGVHVVAAEWARSVKCLPDRVTVALWMPWPMCFAGAQIFSVGEGESMTFYLLPGISHQETSDLSSMTKGRNLS